MRLPTEGTAAAAQSFGGAEPPTDGVCSVFDSEQKHTEEELVMSFRVLEKEAA